MPRRIKAHVRPIRLQKWFPPDDDIAAAVARLCILREDFYLEALAFSAEELPLLDRNGIGWRQLYFLRQIMKTMMEAKSALMPLQQSGKFQSALKKAGPGFSQEVINFLKLVESEDLKEVRNNVGGHVLSSAVKRVLAGLSGDTEELLDVGQTHAETHFKFTTELTARMLLVHKQGLEDRIVTLERIGGVVTAKLLDAIDRVIIAYCEMNGLI